MPHIRISSPRDDVCQKCERLRKEIADARTEEEKLKTVTDFEEHIKAAKRERLHYRKCIQDAINEIGKWQDDQLKQVHYTLDFAQHFQLPHHARQMGPTYFLQLRRVQCFGVRIDSTSMQLNFLIDEDQTIGIYFERERERERGGWWWWGGCDCRSRSNSSVVFSFF